VGATTVPAPEDLEITLDASVSFFLQADRLLLSLRNGNLYVARDKVKWSIPILKFRHLCFP